jgi:PAS domain S-box-containing protein
MSQMRALGQYTICWRPPQLREGNRLVQLSPRQFKILALLVQARGKVVSKDVFFKKVWQGRFIEEGNLTQTIFLLRKALGKLPDGSEFIETVPGRGYRLAVSALQRNGQAEPEAGRKSSNHFPANARLSEGQARLLVDSIEDYAIYLLDSTGRVLTWNRGAELNKGYTSSEVIGQHYSLFFLPEDIESRLPERELAAAAVTGRCSGEGWRLRKSGERFWASYVLKAIRSPGGKLTGYAKVVRDNSEQKQREDALLRIDAVLRRDQYRWRAVTESIMDAVYVCEAVRDQEGEIEDFVFTYLNDKVEQMVSIPRNVLLSGKMCELLPINRTLGLFDAYKRVVLTGEPFMTEFSVRDENVISEWIRVRAVRWEDGVAITACDISDRKRAEEKILHLRPLDN